MNIGNNQYTVDESAFRSVISILVVFLLFISCDEITEPDLNNNLDPKSENYVQYVPISLKVSNSSSNSIFLQWNYPTNNYKGFNVDLGTSTDNFELSYSFNHAYGEISGVDTSLSYYIRVSAFYEDIQTSYSDTIRVEFLKTPGYVVKNKEYFFNESAVNRVAMGYNNEHCLLMNNEADLRMTQLNFKNSHTFSYSAQDLKDVIFSSNEDYILFLTQDGDLFIYHPYTYELLFEIKDKSIDHITAGHNVDYVYYAVDDSIFSFNSKSLAIDDMLIRKMKGEIAKIQLSSLCNYYAVSTGNALKVYDNTTNDLVLDITENAENINSMDFSLDDSYLIYSNEKIYVYDLNTKTKIYEYEGVYNSKIDHVLFLKSSSSFIFSSLDQIFIKSTTDKNDLIVVHKSNSNIEDLKQDKTKEYFICTGNPALYFKVEYMSSSAWHITQIN